MASAVAADEAAVSARAAIAAMAAAGGAPPSWVAIPDSESQERPYLGRVKERLACQNPASTSTALAVGVAERRGASGLVPIAPNRVTARSLADDVSSDEGDSPRRGDDDEDDAAPSVSAAPPSNVFRNARLIEPLLELADIYETVLAGVDKYKAKHHKTVAGALKELDFEVTDVKQLRSNPATGAPLTSAFGKKMSSTRDKVGEILTTGKLQKLETLKRDPRVAALLALEKIWGVGPETARRLYRAGHTSLDALRAAVAAEDAAGKTDPGRVLTPAQRIGLRHYGEFEEKMPRAEAAAIGALVREAVDTVCGPGRCQVTLAGSYRRGKPTCGDADVLVAPRETFADDASQDENERRKSARDAESVARSPSRDVERLVDRLDDILPATLALLRRRGLITADLNSGERRSYMGVCRVPPEVSLPGETADPATTRALAEASETRAIETRETGVVVAGPPRRFRRIDIKVYSPEEYPFALLYFTGSGYFNRSMRWWADKKFHGLSLGDKGFRLESGAKESRFKHDPRFEGVTFSTEKDVFDFLKLQYVEPEDRCV